MSLNAGAKAFVPGGAGGPAAAPNNATSLSVQSKPFVPTGFGTPSAPPSWFRYQWEVLSRSLSLGARDCTLQSLFSKGNLRPSPQGGNAPGVLQQFFNDHFEKPMNTGAATGILVSRVKLSPESTTASVLDNNGYLVAVEAPSSISSEGTSGVSDIVAAAWEECFSSLSSDHRVQAMAHVSVPIGGTQHHYIIISCTDKTKQIEVLSLSNIQSKITARTVTEVRKGLWFALSPHNVAASVILVGFDENAFSKEASVLAEKCYVDETPIVNGAICNVDSVKSLQTFVAKKRDSLLDADTDKSLIPIFLNLEVESSGAPMSFATFLAATIRTLVDLGVPLTAIVVNDEDSSEFGKFVLSETKAMRASDVTSSVVSTVGFAAPHAKIGTGKDIPSVNNCDNVVELSEILDLVNPVWSYVQNRHAQPPSKATRSSVSLLSNGDIRACRRAVGHRVLLIVDNGDGKYGRSFLYCLESKNIMSIPNCWCNPNNACVRSVFAAVLTQSTLIEGQYRLVIDDVLAYNGNVVTAQSFGSRWRMIDASASNPLEDDLSWPHGSPYDLVILKAAFQPLKNAEVFLQTPHPDNVSSGVTLVNWDNSICADKALAWQNPESLTFRFRALHVEEVEMKDSTNSYQVQRVQLGAQDGPYNGEYADFLSISAPSMKKDDILECMLRRDFDGAHWWEVTGVPLVPSDGAEPDAASIIASVVNDPVLSSAELLKQLV